MNLNHVKLNGVVRPFQLNMAALMYVAKQGYTLEALLSLHRPELDEQYHLMYAGLKYGAEATRQPFDMLYSELLNLNLEEENDAAFELMGTFISENYNEITSALERKLKKKQALLNHQSPSESAPE